VALAPNTRLGPYEIVGQIGAGGMGEVYRAHDTKLGRDVALKTLPASLTSDPERVARFRREAQVLAALNHPHIAQIYGFEETPPTGGEHGLLALAMELVDGESLDHRIARGAVPVDEALLIATQIAEALEAAHERGIIHRDLKPANIALTKEGQVKVLDFGLAKSVEASSAPSSMSLSPTITTPVMVTGAGVVLGTAAYMSPEQAKGRASDRRSDLWALGCVLYEMLTGRSAFARADVSDTFVAIMRDEPEWTALPPDTPPGVRRLLRRCLQKNAALRLDSAAVARLDLADTEAAPPPMRRRSLLPIASAAVAAGIVIGALGYSALPSRRAATAPDAGISRLTISVAPADQLGADAVDQTNGLGRPRHTALALSPDGRRIVFTAMQHGRGQLFERPLDRLDATPIPGTEGAHSPFFSPDGQWLGFWSGGALRKINTRAGGPPTRICDLPESGTMGISWGSGDVIYMGGISGPILAVPASGGAPKPVTTLDASRNELSHRFPHALPNGKGLLFTSLRAALPVRWDDAETIDVLLQPLPAGKPVSLVSGGVDAQYVSTGHIVFAAAGVLMAAPFDLERAAVTGEAVALVSDVSQSSGSNTTRTNTGAPHFAASEAGLLAYVTGGVADEPARAIQWVSRAGAVEKLRLPAHPYGGLWMSHDRRRAILWNSGATWDVDLSSSRVTPLTFATGRTGSFFAWTADGRAIAYAGQNDGIVYLHRWDASNEPPLLVKGEHLGLNPLAWTPGGDTLIATDRISADEWALRQIRRTGSTWRVEPYSRTPNARENFAAISPDGRWLAYTTNESNSANEVFVRPLAGPGPRQQVAAGVNPAWSADGRWLYLLGRPNRERGTVPVIGVPVQSGGESTLTIGAAQTIVEGAFFASFTRTMDVGADGRFLTIEDAKAPPLVSREIVVVQRWFEEVRARVPAK
jgi:hypothetical protein